MSTKLSELKEAYNQYDGKWRKYEKDAEEFIKQFRQRLAEYLGCDVKSVQLLQLADKFEDENYYKTSFNQRMWLDNGGFWHFFLRLVLEWQPAMPPITQQESPNKWLNMGFKVKPEAEEVYSVRMPPDSREVEVRSDDYHELVEATYRYSKEFLEGEFRQFLEGGGKQGGLGFSVPQS